MTNCRFCFNGHNNEILPVYEMLLGSRELFHYRYCSSCQSLQLCEEIEDMGKYYPPDLFDHFSGQICNIGFSDIDLSDFPSWTGLTDAGLIKDFLYLLFDGQSPSLCDGSISAVLTKRFINHYLKPIESKKNARILDVGCGSGELLRCLRDIGFRDLHGVDKFFYEQKDEEEITWIPGTIHDVEGEFDLITNDQFSRTFDVLCSASTR